MTAITRIFDSLAKIISKLGKLGFNNVSIGSSVADDSHVYGRDVDREKIIKLLLKDEPKISVIPIVGMGGIGKTTLVQFVYNDSRVESHFDMKAWTFVSDDFDVVRITKSILKSVGFAASDSDDLIGLQDKVKEALTGKKFLIVLDDVWSNNYADWDVLMSPIRVGAPGSKIIVTTRDRSVGFMMGTVDSYYLERLSNEDCWKLFVEHAFGNRNIDTNFAVIGKNIVTKCKGLPLAIKTLGGLLRSKPEENEWKVILNSGMWTQNNDSLLSRMSYDNLPSHLKRCLDRIRDENNDILPALLLCSSGLPSHLKRCFAYCSIFPNDYEFEEGELVQRWIAEGLVQQPDGTRQMEDLAVEYFRDLLSRSFFQQSSNNKSLFVMHDLVHDLAQWMVDQTNYSFKDVLEDKKKDKISKKHYNFQAFWKWLFVISNISFEILASAFDQLSSPKKPGYALAGLVMSLVAVAVCLTEFGWKARKEKVTMGRWGPIWWFYYRSPRGRLYGTFAEIFGIICAILQVISSAIQFGFLHQHADYPIKISIFPIIFAVCVSGSKFINNPNEHPRQGHSVVVHGETELEGIAVQP